MLVRNVIEREINARAFLTLNILSIGTVSYIPSCFSTLTLTHMYECVCSISYDDDAIDDAILSEVRTYSAKIQQADTVLQLTANTDWQKYRLYNGLQLLDVSYVSSLSSRRSKSSTYVHRVHNTYAIMQCMYELVHSSLLYSVAALYERLVIRRLARRKSTRGRSNAPRLKAA